MKKQNINLYLASPRGFCAGVDRAVKIGEETIKKFGSPGYVRHEIVHNKDVVNSLAKIGAVFVEAVSYTHLRAHETPEHLVCRLLLEKKKNPTNIQNKYKLQ